MDPSENPYKPPLSEVTDISGNLDGQQLAVYSPVQGAMASFLGGPLVGTYFISQNYWALGKSSHARKALIWGVIFSVALICSSPFLPERTPKIILPLAYSWVVRLVIEKLQFSKGQIRFSGNISRQSNWKVFGLGLLSLVITTLAIIGIFILYNNLGLFAAA